MIWLVAWVRRRWRETILYTGNSLPMTYKEIVKPMIRYRFWSLHDKFSRSCRGVELSCYVNIVILQKKSMISKFSISSAISTNDC